MRSEIQRRIISGDIPSGATLPEQAVAQMFDVARPTAKAAIEQLVNLGLLRRSHNKTASVPLFDAADVMDLYLSRGVVENAVVSLLAERGVIPAGAVEALNRFRAMIKQKDKVAELVKCDIDFHHALVTASGSPRLSRLHASVIGETHLCMVQVQVHHLLHPQVIADEHARILAVIEAGDADKARQEMSAHISRARDKLLGYIKRQKTAKAG
jgi:DNA-binding GntR family transcriptional regulator